MYLSAFWWRLKTTVTGRQILRCVLYRKCLNTILHSACSYREREISWSVMYSIYLLIFSYPDSPEPLWMRRGFDKPPQHWPHKALAFANFIIIFFCLLSHAAATLVNQPWEVSIILMKIYRRLYVQTVNQLCGCHSSLPSVGAGVRHLTRAHLSSVGPVVICSAHVS